VIIFVVIHAWTFFLLKNGSDIFRPTRLDILPDYRPFVKASE